MSFPPPTSLSRTTKENPISRNIIDGFHFYAGWLLAGTLVAMPVVVASGLFGSAVAISFMAQAASTIRQGERHR